LLRHRFDQLPAEGCVLGARPAGSALSPAAGSGGGRTSARPLVCRTKENSGALRRAVFSMRGRRRGPAFQPPADRRRVDQGNGVPLGCARAGPPALRGGSMTNGAGGATAQTRQPGTGGAPAGALSEVHSNFRLADGGSYAAVKRASLDVADGEFVAIVGPTGCGKSTLLNVAAGVLAPSNGSATHFGTGLARV